MWPGRRIEVLNVHEFGELSVENHMTFPPVNVEFHRTMHHYYLDWQELARLIAEIPDWRLDIDPL